MGCPGVGLDLALVDTLAWVGELALDLCFLGVVLSLSMFFQFLLVLSLFLLTWRSSQFFLGCAWFQDWLLCACGDHPGGVIVGYVAWVLVSGFRWCNFPFVVRQLA